MGLHCRTNHTLLTVTSTEKPCIAYIQFKLLISCHFKLYKLHLIHLNACFIKHNTFTHGKNHFQDYSCVTLMCVLHSLAVRSNQIKLYSYSQKSQSHCLNGLHNLYSERHPLSLDPRFEWGKQQWKKPQEEPQRRDPSFRTDIHAIDVACTEKSNRSQFTSYINRMSDTNCA